MNELPQLYALDSKGRIKLWKAEAISLKDGTAIVRKTHGLKGGKTQVNDRKILKGKNIGKKNETTPFEQAVNEATSAWNRKKDGNYSENESDIPECGLPMLAQSFNKYGHRIVYPCVVQKKLNGVRCLAEKVDKETIVYLSRKGKKYETLEHLTPHLLKMMEVGDIYDGEIYVHGDITFQQLISYVKKLQPESKKLEYWVYDMANKDMAFSERRELQLIQMELVRQGQQPKVIFLADYPGIKGENEIYKKFGHFVSKGYEGIIIRNMDGMYKFDYRSVDLQKYKEFIDQEFKIIGGYEGEGLAEGNVTFKCITKSGKEFGVVPKGSFKYRNKLWLDLPNLIGKEITVRYQTLSDDGVPIFPVGVAIRDYE